MESAKQRLSAVEVASSQATADIARINGDLYTSTTGVIAVLGRLDGTLAQYVESFDELEDDFYGKGDQVGIKALALSMNQILQGTLTEMGLIQKVSHLMSDVNDPVTGLKKRLGDEEGKVVVLQGDVSGLKTNVGALTTTVATNGATLATAVEDISDL